MLAAVLALWSAPLRAQSATGTAEGLFTRPDRRWTHFTQQTGGLASNDVLAVISSDEAVWFGTEQGVSRYDGMWTTFAAPVGEEAIAPMYGQPPQEPVRALATGSCCGEVWAGGDSGQLYRWDGRAWRHSWAAPSPIQAVVDWRGEVYVGAADGLYRFGSAGIVRETAHSGAPVFALLVHGDRLWAGCEDGLWRREQDGWVREADEPGHFIHGVYALGRAADGSLAAGTVHGAALRNANTGEWRLVPVRDEYGRDAAVQALVTDRDGRLWAGTDGAGAYEFTLDPLRAVVYGPAGNTSLTTRFVRGIAVDADGNIWYATPAGAFRFQAHMWRTEIQGQGEGDLINHVNDLLVDRQGRLWVATGGGGIRVKVKPSAEEVVYTPEDGVPSRVLTLAEAADGAIWAGTFTGVFRYATGGWEQALTSDLLPSLVVTVLLSDGPYMWIGTDLGLIRYDTRDGSVEPLLEFAQQSVEALMLDGRSRLWVGTQHSGVWQRRTDGQWVKHAHNPEDEASIPGNWIIGSGLAPDWRADGHIWAIVYNAGLVYWDGQAWSPADLEGQVASSLIWTLEVEADAGMLWVGSEAGVSLFDGRTWGSLTPEDGLNSPVVYAIEPAEEGAYWIGGPAGLSYYRPDRRPPWVRIGSFTGDFEMRADGAIEVPVGEALQLSIAAGDLQTDRDKLELLYRRSGPGDDGGWQEVTANAIETTFEEAGQYRFEIVARDLSFNYSEPAVQTVNAFVPPPKVNVPGLGLVAPNTFRALIVLGLISTLGAGYITVELLNHRRRSIDAVNRGFNPYVSGEPVRRDDMFYARRGLVQRIVNTLHNNSIMIHGERRIGKTTLLFQLMAALREVDDADYWFAPIYVDLEGTPQEAFFHFLIEEIVDGALRLPDSETAILPRLDGLRYRRMAATEYSDREFNRDLRRVIDALQEYGAVREGRRQLRLILLMDEMDVMSKYDHLVQQQLRRIFMREFATTVGAVVAGIRISKEWDRVESPWYNLFNEIELEPFTPEQALELLIAPVQGYYRYEPEAIEFILDHADGRPYRIQQYGLEAVNHMLADRRRKIVVSDALAAHERIEANNGGVV